MNSKDILNIILGAMVGVALIMIGFKIGSPHIQVNEAAPVSAPAAPLGGAAAYNTAPSFLTASSTAYTLTTTSVRLLSTSTPTKRLAATVQPVNCTAGGIFLRLGGDALAVANTGFAVYASTTANMQDYPNIPVTQGSIQGIAGAGTCTVLVTEWRSQY